MAGSAWKAARLSAFPTLILFIMDVIKYVFVLPGAGVKHGVVSVSCCLGATDCTYTSSEV